LASIIRVRIQSVSVFRIRIYSNNPNTEESSSFSNRADSRLGQLEDTFGYKKWGEKGGTLLSHKLFIEDMFIRKFLKVKRFFSSRTFFIQNKNNNSATSTGGKVRKTLEKNTLLSYDCCF
jgi:hypothetical protein